MAHQELWVKPSKWYSEHSRPTKESEFAEGLGFSTEYWPIVKQAVFSAYDEATEAKNQGSSKRKGMQLGIDKLCEEVTDLEAARGRTPPKWFDYVCRELYHRARVHEYHRLGVRAQKEELLSPQVQNASPSSSATPLQDRSTQTTTPVSSIVDSPMHDVDDDKGRINIFVAVEHEGKAERIIIDVDSILSGDGNEQKASYNYLVRILKEEFPKLDRIKCTTYWKGIDTNIRNDHSLNLIPNDLVKNNIETLEVTATSSNLSPYIRVPTRAPGRPNKAVVSVPVTRTKIPLPANVSFDLCISDSEVPLASDILPTVRKRHLPNSTESDTPNFRRGRAKFAHPN